MEGSHLLPGVIFLAAPYVIDGDLKTFWEPKREDDVNSWYVEIDLGRTIIAQRIVVRLLQRRGRPLPKISRHDFGWTHDVGSDNRRQYCASGRSTFEIKTSESSPLTWIPCDQRRRAIAGAVTQFVRIDVLDSDGDRGAEVTPDARHRTSRRRRPRSGGLFSRHGRWA